MGRYNIAHSNGCNIRAPVTYIVAYSVYVKSYWPILSLSQSADNVRVNGVVTRVSNDALILSRLTPINRSIAVVDGDKM